MNTAIYRPVSAPARRDIQEMMFGSAAMGLMAGLCLDLALSKVREHISTETWQGTLAILGLSVAAFLALRWISILGTYLRHPVN